MTMSHPDQSLMMEKLYGSEIAKIVYQRCQELGEDFNHRVQRYVYDIIWAKPGLTLKEKSLITVVALISVKKAEQLKVHLWGFFHQGGTDQDVLNLLDYMKQQNYIATRDDALVIFKLAEKEYSNFTKRSIALGITLDLDNSREKSIVDFAAHLALGNNEKTKICTQVLLKNESLTTKEMQHIMQHEAVYCGFPVEMNGLAVLYDIFHAKDKLENIGKL